MLYYRCYGIKPKPELRTCPDLDQEITAALWDEPFLYRNEQGGRSIWSCDDHIAVVKLVFLLSCRSQYGEAFFRGAPLSVKLFDRWWSIDWYFEPVDVSEVLDNINPQDLEGMPEIGRRHVDEYLQSLRNRNPRTEFPVGRSKYRVWLKGDVVGWIEDPRWDLPYLRGKWNPTTNPAGRSFAAEAKDADSYEVVIDGDSYFHSEMQLQAGFAQVKVAFVASEKEQAR